MLNGQNNNLLKLNLKKNNKIMPNMNEIIYALSVCIFNSLLPYISDYNDIFILLIVKFPSLCKYSRRLFIENCPDEIIRLCIKKSVINSDLYVNLPYSFYDTLIYEINNPIYELFNCYSNQCKDDLISFASVLSQTNNLKSVICINDYLNAHNDKHTSKLLYTINSIYDKYARVVDSNSIFSSKTIYYLLKNKCIWISPSYFFNSGLCVEAVYNADIYILKKYYSYMNNIINTKSITKDGIEHIKNAAMISLRKNLYKNFNKSKKVFKIVCETNPIFTHTHFFIESKSNNVDTYLIEDEIYIKLLQKITKLSFIFAKSFKKIIGQTESLEILRYYINHYSKRKCIIDKYNKLTKYCKKQILNLNSTPKHLDISINTLKIYNLFVSKCRCITQRQYLNVLKLYRDNDNFNNNKMLQKFLEHYRHHFYVLEILSMTVKASKYKTN